MRQCPDCEEKDRVVIAGKVFCANCGSPWQAADPTEQEKYLQKVGLGAAPAEAAPLPAAAPSAEQAQATAIDAAMKAANLASPEPAATPAPAAPATPEATQAAPPAATPAPAVTPEAPPATPAPPAPTPVPDPEPVVTPITPTPAPVAPVSAPVEAPAPAPTPAAAPAPVANPFPAPATPVAVAVAPASDVQTAAPKEDIGSEIPTLDGKDEDILSDGQLSELSTIQSAPTMTRPVDSPTLPPIPTPAPAPAPNPGAPVRTMSDITPPGAANTPASAATPAPAANTPAADTTTIAGITMSRDDALKLALGPDGGAGDTAPKKGPARPTAVVMSVLALALLGVYTWQSNYPTLALKLAGMRSGVEAAAPSYLPSGWTMSRDVQSSTGNVSFKVIKNNQELTVSQQKSGWDSQAVLEQFVLPRSSDYLALQAQGLTIYVYGAGEAAWVNHGTFYHLEGNHGLDQDQLIRVATGL